MKKRVKNSDIKKFINEQFQWDVELDVDKALENVKERMELPNDNDDDSEPLHPIYTFPRKKFCAISICSLIGTFLCGGVIAGVVTYSKLHNDFKKNPNPIQNETKDYLLKNFDNYDSFPSVILSFGEKGTFSIIKSYRNTQLYFIYEFYARRTNGNELIQITYNHTLLTEFQIVAGVVYSVIDLTPNTIYQITVFSNQEYSAFFSVC